MKLDIINGEDLQLKFYVHTINNETNILIYHCILKCWHNTTIYLLPVRQIRDWRYRSKIFQNEMNYKCHWCDGCCVNGFQISFTIIHDYYIQNVLAIVCKCVSTQIPMGCSNVFYSFCVEYHQINSNVVCLSSVLITVHSLMLILH